MKIIEKCFVNHLEKNNNNIFTRHYSYTLRSLLLNNKKNNRESFRFRFQIRNPSNKDIILRHIIRSQLKISAILVVIRRSDGQHIAFGRKRQTCNSSRISRQKSSLQSSSLFSSPTDEIDRDVSYSRHPTCSRMHPNHPSRTYRIVCERQWH